MLLKCCEYTCDPFSHLLPFPPIPLIISPQHIVPQTPLDLPSIKADLDDKLSDEQLAWAAEKAEMIAEQARQEAVYASYKEEMKAAGVETKEERDKERAREEEEAQQKLCEALLSQSLEMEAHAIESKRVKEEHMETETRARDVKERER